MTTLPIGLVGTSNRAGSIAQQSGRSINLYPEVNDSDAKAQIALHSAPGIETWGDLSSAGNMRGQHRMGDRLFVVAGTNIYEITTSTFGTPTLRGVLATATGRVGLSDNNGKLIIGDGLFWLIDPDSGITTPAPILDDGEEQLTGTFSVWIDSYTVYFLADAATPGRYRYSALNDPATINGEDFMTAEGDPDQTVWAGNLNRQLVMLGERSAQFAYNSGGSDNAFAAVSGAFQHVGCLCRWTAQLYADTVVFVGTNDDGAGGVFSIADQGATAVEISTPAVANAIREALKTNDPETFTAYTYDEANHRFYVLSWPTGTWVFEKGLGWTERARLNPSTGLLERVRQDYAIYWKGKHRCGAYNSGKVYTQSKDIYLDDADPLLRRRETAHFSAGGKTVQIDKLLLDIEVGVGLDGDGSGTNPLVMLQTSIDGGRSYSDEMLSRALGALGATRTRVQFDRLGRATDWVFRVSVSDPVPVVMLAGYADVRVGR